MAEYIDFPLESDPEDILNDAYVFLQNAIPGWTPAEPNLDVWLLQAFASAAAELREVVTAVPTDIFRWFGATLLRLPPNAEAAATTTVKFTAVNNAGYTIPDGTQLSIPRTGDEDVAFQVIGDWVIPPGNTQLSGIAVEAVEPGAAGSSLGTINGAVNLLDPLTWVTAVTQDAVTSGGVDAEDDTTYLNRLAAELELLAPRPILANDFAVFARNIVGVYRATGIDGYNPAGGGTYNNPKTVAVAVIDAAGNPVSTTVKNAVVADLAARREANFVVNVIDPTITLIDVTYTVKARAGYATATVVANVNAALQGYLSAASWGTVPGSNPRDWVNNTVVRYLEVAQVINQVDGVDYITTTAGNYDLLIGVHGGALARADVALTGAAPLPNTSTLTGTAV